MPEPRATQRQGHTYEFKNQSVRAMSRCPDTTPRPTKQMNQLFLICLVLGVVVGGLFCMTKPLWCRIVIGMLTFILSFLILVIVIILGGDH